MPEDKPHWFRVVIGALLIAGFFWQGKDEIIETELVTRTITVSHPIQEIKGRKSRISFRLYAKEFAGDFVIKTAGEMASMPYDLNNITKGDTLIIKIHSSRVAELSEESADIPIYSLTRTGTLIFDVDGYNRSQKDYDRRWSIIMIVIGLLLVARGLVLISSKTTWILAILSLAVIICLRVFYPGW